MITMKENIGIPDGVPDFIEHPGDWTTVAPSLDNASADRATVPETLGDNDDYEDGLAGAPAGHYDGPPREVGDRRADVHGGIPRYDVAPETSDEPPRLPGGGNDDPPEMPPKRYGGEAGGEDDDETPDDPEIGSGTRATNPHAEQLGDYSPSERTGVILPGDTARAGLGGRSGVGGGEVISPGSIERAAQAPQPDAAEVSEALTGPTLELPIQQFEVNAVTEVLNEPTAQLPLIPEVPQIDESTLTEIPSLEEVAEAPERDGRAELARQQWEEFMEAGDAGMADAYIRAATGAVAITTIRDNIQAARGDVAGAEQPADDALPLPQEMPAPDPAVLQRMPEQRAPGIEFELPPIYDATAYGRSLHDREPGVAGAVEDQARQQLVQEGIPPEITNFLHVAAAVEGMPGTAYDPEMIPRANTVQDTVDADARRAAAGPREPDYFVGGKDDDLQRVMGGIGAIGTGRAYQDPPEIQQAERAKNDAYKRFGAFGSATVAQGERWRGIPPQPSGPDNPSGLPPAPTNG